MAGVIQKINRFFKNAIKKDVDKIKDTILLTERQEVIFDMFYIKGDDIDFITDSLCVCRMVVNNELKTIRQKLIKILDD